MIRTIEKSDAAPAASSETSPRYCGCTVEGSGTG
jgi:hypothetical protein